MCKYLETVKNSGTPALLSQQDLETMFAMFDLTNRGAITGEQANAALQSILGPGASLETEGVRPGSILKKHEFVSAMTQALREALPYKT